MTELSVQLNKLNVGSHHLDSGRLSPAHQKRGELYLSKILSDHSIATAGKEIPFHVRLVPGRPLLRIDDREIPLEKSPELQGIERIARFYQHTGHLPRASLKPQERASGVDMAKKVIQGINEASIPGTNGQILAGMRIAEDTLSLTRNILFAIPDIGSSDPVVNHLGYYAGVFWAFFAFRELDEGWSEFKRSQAIGDAEGKRRSQARLVSGSICSTASLVYLAGRVSDTFAVQTAATAAFGTASALFGIGSLLGMGASLLGALRCSRFNDRLNEYLENPRLSERERFQGALQFLKDAISVTPEEKAELTDQLEKSHPHWSPEQKEKWLREKLADLTEVKVKYMKRRTSSKSLYLILTQADELLAKLSDPKRASEGIKEATILFSTIQQENKTKLALYLLGFIAALVSFSAMLVATFFTAGALPFVLYGIAGTIYLATTLYSVAGMALKKELDYKGMEMHPIQDLALHGPHPVI